MRCRHLLSDELLNGSAEIGLHHKREAGHGLLHSLLSAIQLPRPAPCRSMTSRAYAEQVGVNRHEGGVIGDTAF